MIFETIPQIRAMSIQERFCSLPNFGRNCFNRLEKGRRRTNSEETWRTNLLAIKPC